MGKNDSVLPKGGERRAGGPPPRLLGGRGGASQSRAARPPAVPYSPGLGAGMGICRRGRQQRHPTGRGSVTNEVLGGKSPAISSQPLSLHKQLSARPGARAGCAQGRPSRAASLEHTLDVALRNVGQTLQASRRGVFGPPLGRASGENIEFPKLLHPAAPIRRVSIVTSACFLRVRDLICLVKGSVAVRLTAGNQLC